MKDHEQSQTIIKYISLHEYLYYYISTMIDDDDD
jgi:hypothetical protein